MLTIELKETEYYDRDSNTFFTVPAYTLQLEHSLYSLSEWEAKTKKSLLETLEHGMSTEETFEYIKCMDLNVPPSENVYFTLTKDDLVKIQQYIDDPHTATTITTLNPNQNQPVKKQKITAEIIYYWMIEAEIPFECERWNLNKLIMLIRVVSAKRNNGKMSNKDLKKFNKAEMAKRRAKCRGH